VEYANSCDTLLSNANLKIANRDKHIQEKIFQVKNLQDQIAYKDTLIVNREKKIGELGSEIIELNEHKKMLKLAWASTTALLSGILISFILF
jgi:alkylhydroperoxidase family enzyme